MRISRMAVLGAASLSVAACHMSSDMPMEPPPISASFDLQLQPVTGTAGLVSPMDLQAPPGDSRLFIAERAGRIRIVKNGVLLATPFLDLNAVSLRVYTDGEAGLLSFAFDPKFATNGFVYVHFIENIPTTFGDIVVERYHVSSDPDVLETPGTEVIRIPHRDANNHYGGHVFIGPDGMLYLSTGDGGGGNNQFRHAQDDASLLGKMLRLDVSSLPYAIPSDNPTWSGTPQTRREIWAIGLRNPFRYAFDGNQLYIADVGQGAREEIDVVDASAAGLNYGWSIMEGTQCFDGPCPTPGLTPPVYDYDHGQGCAIIGGYVYRGSAMSGLQGTYFFSDLCTGFLRGLTMQNGVATVVQAPNANTGTPLSFGQDGAGEIYVLNAGNQVLKIVKP
jgi:hypothetical protein